MDDHVYTKNPDLDRVYIPGVGLARDGDLYRGAEYEKYTLTRPPLLVAATLPEVPKPAPKRVPVPSPAPKLETLEEPVKEESKTPPTKRVATRKKRVTKRSR